MNCKALEWFALHGAMTMNESCIKMSSGWNCALTPYMHMSSGCESDKTCLSLEQVG